MARAISDEELLLKRRARRRLLGAIVLVTAIVVVLPMVLDTEPRPVSQNITIRIPSTDSETFKAKVAPPPVVKAPDRKSAAAPAVPKDKETPKPAVQPEVAPAKAPAAKVPENAPAKTAAKATKPATKAGGGPFVVQVIALADADKAQRLQGQIAAAGIKSYTEVVDRKSVV